MVAKPLWLLLLLVAGCTAAAEPPTSGSRYSRSPPAVPPPPCAAGEHAVGPACVDPRSGAVTSLGGATDGAASLRLPTNFTTALDGCLTASVASSVAGPNLTVTRHLLCGSTRYVRVDRGATLWATVEEKWSPGPTLGSVLWSVTISSPEPRFWTAPINSHYSLPPSEAEGMLLWTGASPPAGTAARLEQGFSSLTPTALSAFPAHARAVPYSGKTVSLPISTEEDEAAAAPPPGPGPATWDGSGATTLPLLALLQPARGFGIGVVHDPANHPLEAWLDRVPPQPLTWHRRWFRLGNGTTPIVLQQHLLWHDHADWRPTLGFLRTHHAEFFEVDERVNETKIEGGGAYADYRGEADTTGVVGDDSVLIGGPSALGDYANELKAMGFQVNWDAGEQMISHGQWVPYNLTTQEPFTGQWETCFAHPNFTAMNAHVAGSESHYPSVCWKLNYTDMNGYYEDLQSFGFSTLTYGNYWEYGLDVRPTDSNLSELCDSHSPARWTNGPRVLPANDFSPRVRGICDSNLFLRQHMPRAPWRRWTDAGNEPGKVTPAGMMGAAAMDAADPDYQAHLLRMVDLLLSELPASEGVCFDGTGWGGYVNIEADDGVSFIEYWPPVAKEGEETAASEKPLLRGRTARTQVMSMVAATAAIGEALHAAGKVHAHNSYAPRMDFWRHIDAVFSENGFRDDLMHHNSLLGVGGKPVIAWQPGCGRDPTFVQCPPKELWDWPSYEEMTPANAQAAQHRLLMRLLYYGNQPAMPFPRNDHTVTPYIAKQQGLLPIFKAFAPLFRRIRGRQWVLAAHAVTVTNGTAQANLFKVEGGTVFVAPVVFAPRVSTVALSLRGVVLTCVGHHADKLQVSAMGPVGTPNAASIVHATSVGVGAVDVVLRFGPDASPPSPAGAADATSCALVVLQCANGLSE